MRRVYFTMGASEAFVYARQHNGRVLTASQHPDENHKTLKAWNEGGCDLIVADWTMATGWRVEGGDIAVEFSETFPTDGAGRIQAEARVKNPNSLF